MTDEEAEVIKRVRYRIEQGWPKKTVAQIVAEGEKKQ